MNTMVRMVYPFLPAFGRGLGVDLWLLSLAITYRQVAGALAPFLASVADRRGRKTGMLFGLALFTTGAGLLLLWPSYLTFALSLALTLVGNLVFIPSMQAYLGDRIEYKRRALVMGLTEFGWSLSFIVGIPLMGLLIAHSSWQAPFAALATAGLVSLVGLAWLLPRDPKPQHSQPALWRSFNTVLTNRHALAGLLFGMLITAANELINLVLGVWLEDSFGLKIAALGAASAVIGFSELSAEGMVSGLTDRLGKARAIRLGLVSNSIAVLALPWLGRNLGGALISLFLFYLTFEFTLVSTIPLMTEILPQARATTMSIFIAVLSLGRAIGDLAGTPLYTSSPSSGMIVVAVAAVGFNLLALIALPVLRKGVRDQT